MPSRKKKTKPNKVSIIGIKYWNLLGKNTKNKYIITRENVKTQQTMNRRFVFKIALPMKYQIMLNLTIVF